MFSLASAASPLSVGRRWRLPPPALLALTLPLTICSGAALLRSSFAHWLPDKSFASGVARLNVYRGWSRLHGWRHQIDKRGYRTRPRSAAYARQLRGSSVSPPIGDLTIQRVVVLAVLASLLVGITVCIIEVARLSGPSPLAGRGELLAVIFESVSAFGTVGLSMGLTSALSADAVEPGFLDTRQLGEDIAVVEVAPDGVVVVACRDMLRDELHVNPDPEGPIANSDALVVLGRDEDIDRFVQRT